jgi:ABC-type transport system involved in multi-copper enzyme maturation permease subunit
MIWKIAKKEFLLNLMTFKFAVGTIVCVVLTAVFMPILAKDYQRRLEDYNGNVAANEAELRKVKVYKNITPTIYRSPNVLSVFSEGLEKQFGQSAKIELGGFSEIITASEAGNPFLSIFQTLDVMLILKVVMSILALLVAYDTISGERERGTLRLVLANRTARHEVLLGKLLAGLVTLIIPVTSAFIIGLLILQFFPMVSLAGADWIRIGLIYLASLIFISAMYNIGLLFSCLMSRSSISLVLGLFIWVVFVVVIPNGSVYLANYLRPTESREKMAAQVKALMQERNNKIDDLTKTLRTGGSQAGAFGAFGNYFILMCEKPLMDDYRKKYTLSEPVKIKYAEKIFEVQQQYLDRLIKQKYLAHTIAQISPVTLYESLMSALTGTDLANFEHFRNRVKLHTDEAIEYIRSKTESFSSPAYFTPGKEADHLAMVKEMDRIEKTHADKFFEEVKKWYDQKLEQTPSLSLRDLPHFICGPESLASTLSRSISRVMLLLFINALFFTLSFVAFLKYDVR